MRSGVFGTWDAPVTDGLPKVAAPVGDSCCYCQEPVVDGDNGAVWPTGVVEHRECSLRLVTGGIGHLIDHEAFCGSELGADAGLSFRRSALLVWARLAEGREITPEQLLAEVEAG